MEDLSKNVIELEKKCIEFFNDVIELKPREMEAMNHLDFHYKGLIKHHVTHYINLRINNRLIYRQMAMRRISKI